MWCSATHSIVTEAKEVRPRVSSDRGHTESNMDERRTVTAMAGGWVSLLGLLAKIKCSICSYQFNI